MTTFNEREKAFESKFQHDEELRFKAEMRRNKLVGLWAAGEMGISGEEAEAYAKTVVEADFEEPGHEDVIRKVLGDFEAKGVEISDHLLRRKMDELLTVAMEQIMQETK
jgi:hypothetical protein